MQCASLPFKGRVGVGMGVKLIAISLLLMQLN
jgi:hypothetical protein